MVTYIPLSLFDLLRLSSSLSTPFRPTLPPPLPSIFPTEHLFFNWLWSTSPEDHVVPPLSPPPPPHCPLLPLLSCETHGCMVHQHNGTSLTPFSPLDPISSHPAAPGHQQTGELYRPHPHQGRPPEVSTGEKLPFYMHNLCVKCNVNLHTTKQVPSVHVKVQL